MANLLIIIGAKAALLAVIAAAMGLSTGKLARIIALGLLVGGPMGLAFFALFYRAVPAIDYRAEVTWAFVAVNALLSYGATAATVTLLPVGLAERPRPIPLRDRLYFGALAAAALAVFPATGNAFARALAIGVLLMAAAEAAALLLGKAGPVSRMLHGEARPMAAVLAANAGLGVFYETLNLAFPVWEWVALDEVPGVARTGLMMGIGYIILVHPLFLAVRLVEPPPWRGAGAEA